MTTTHDSRPRVRVALVGAGFIANYHLAAVRTIPGAQVDAVCDLQLRRAERFAASHAIRSVYRSVDDLLEASQIDVIHVLTPPNAHLDPARAALEAGVDALIEKPLCHTSEACRSLLDLSDRQHRVIGVSHNFLFYSPYERLAQDIRSGRLGKLDQVDIVWSKPLGQLRAGPFNAWMLQHPENILFEVAAHSFAHLAHLVGRPDRIDVHPYDRIDLPLGRSFYRRWEIMTWKDDTTTRLRLSFIDGYPEHYIHVRGTQAVAHCDFVGNTYVCLEHTPHMLDVDRFLNVAAASRDAVIQAGSTLAGFVMTKAGLGDAGGPYQRSISRAVGAFYAGRQGALDERVSGTLAETAVGITEWVAREANLPTSIAPVARAKLGRPAQDLDPTVLVVGGTGFIGKALVRRLRREGHAVRVVARDPTACPDELLVSGIEVVPGDFMEPDTIAAAMTGIRVVYHLARGGGETWSEYCKSDVEPTRTLAELCLRYGVERLFYTSSIALYNAGRTAGIITEETPPAPNGDLYARSKAENERNLLDLHAGRGLPVVIFRPGIVLGRGGSPLHWGIAGWPYPSVARLWGLGDHRLPIVLADDCADAMVRALTVRGIEGRSYNLVGPPLITANEYLDELESRAGIRLRRVPTPSWRYFVEEIAKWLVKKVGRDSEARRPTYAEWDGRTFAARLDGGRAERELGWTPTQDRETLVREGIHVPVDEWFELGRPRLPVSGECP